MRSFNNFLREATETSASRQAKLLGLVGDGHGGWYDAKGKFVAKTEQGKLKFYGQGGAKPQDDKPTQKIQTEPEKKVPTELETIGKLEAIGTVLGCMFDPAPCEEKKKQAETEELEKHGNTK